MTAEDVQLAAGEPPRPEPIDRDRPHRRQGRHDQRRTGWGRWGTPRRRVGDQTLQLRRRPTGVQPVAHVALLRQAGQGDDPHAGGDPVQRGGDLLGVAAAGGVVVR